jgi:hypothetical protein
MVKMAKSLGKTAAALGAAALIAQSPVAPQEIPSDTWMGIYFADSKIGYARFRIDKSEFRGKQGYRLDNTSVTRLLVLGEEVGTALDTTIYLDKDFAPVYQTFKMSSAGHETVVTAKFGEKEIIAEVESEGTKSVKAIPIPTGSKVVGDSTFFSTTMKLNVGDRVNVRTFNPLTLSLDDIQTEVLRKEGLTLGDKFHETYVIKSLTPLGEMTCWQDEIGNLLKVTAIMGLTMIREPEELAKNITGGYTPPSDLAVMTSAPTSTEIPNPRQVKYMKIRLSGLADKALVINDSRQKATFTEGEKPAVEFEITATDFSPAKAVSLPIEGEKFRKLLAESPYVQPSNEEISKRAGEVVGDEKNAYLAVSRLRTWVNANMQSKGNIGIVRSSVDILHAKTGVCRDYAVLFTALARAAGVPTKLVAGLVFFKDGFYYHAWAESFVGEWIPVDPTLPVELVDATHIKLAEGDATAMFDMVKTMGSIKAEVLGFK